MEGISGNVIDSHVTVIKIMRKRLYSAAGVKGSSFAAFPVPLQEFAEIMVSARGMKPNQPY